VLQNSNDAPRHFLKAFGNKKRRVIRRTATDGRWRTFVRQNKQISQKNSAQKAKCRKTHLAKKKGVGQGAPEQMDDGELSVRRVHL
jgi:hypothetical protein